jgi:hypothetical protein
VSSGPPVQATVAAFIFVVIVNRRRLVKVVACAVLDFIIFVIIVSFLSSQAIPQAFRAELLSTAAFK